MQRPSTPMVRGLELRRTEAHLVTRGSAVPRHRRAADHTGSERVALVNAGGERRRGVAPGRALADRRPRRARAWERSHLRSLVVVASGRLVVRAVSLPSDDRDHAAARNWIARR
jgi:hypothetical protein